MIEGTRASDEFKNFLEAHKKTKEEFDLDMKMVVKVFTTVIETKFPTLTPYQASVVVSSLTAVKNGVVALAEEKFREKANAVR